jgi:hypothetical protein
MGNLKAEIVEQTTHLIIVNTLSNRRELRRNLTTFIDPYIMIKLG